MQTAIRGAGLRETRDGKPIKAVFGVTVMWGALAFLPAEMLPFQPGPRSTFAP